MRTKIVDKIMKSILMLMFIVTIVSGLSQDVYAVTRYSTNSQVQQQLSSQIEASDSDHATLSVNLTKKKFNYFYNNRNKIVELLSKAAANYDLKISDVSSRQSKVTYYKGKSRIVIKAYFDEAYVVNSDAEFYKAAIKLLKNRNYDKYIYYAGAQDRVYDLAKAVYCQFPEYNTAALSFKSQKVNGTTYVTYSLQKNYTKSDMKTYYDEANTAANNIIKTLKISNMSSDKDKAKAIHDYLIKNCTYNNDATANDSQYITSYMAYGCLVEKKAVCQGYAAAFNLLMHKAGISCIADVGTANNGVNSGVAHAWNYASIDGSPLYYDVTFDATGKDSSAYCGVAFTKLTHIEKMDATASKYEKGLAYSKYAF